MGGGGGEKNERGEKGKQKEEYQGHTNSLSTSVRFVTLL